MNVRDRQSTKHSSSAKNKAKRLSAAATCVSASARPNLPSFLSIPLFFHINSREFCLNFQSTSTNIAFGLYLRTELGIIDVNRLLSLVSAEGLGEGLIGDDVEFLSVCVEKDTEVFFEAGLQVHTYIFRRI